MKQRIITGVIAAGLFIPVVFFGGLTFSLLIYAIATICLYEMLRMKKLSLFSGHGIISLFALYVFLMPNEWAKQLFQRFDYSKIDLAIFSILIMLAYTVLVKNRFTFDDAAFAILSSLYIGIGFYYFIETRHAGLEFVLFALLVIWMTDTGAYFTGRRFGKHKLWPDISPNKTIEGFVGGIVTAIIFVLIFQLLYPLTSSWTYLFVVTIIASIVGQIGDLVESAIKRHYHVKDSGTILPGHGGLLDRFDSLIFVLPVIHLLHFVG
ncbi:phosphatidate cytidylyltransferase [Paenisporosarcina cavernae]|uniref:Phosphatidate cytidylyltransferase n=1 Tax=Paenisporosarcina cavernae TaxID=2320858 RepID=A0A385YUW6_9BACL|nr:phosphatidate cytidylyltransferase [Paenisporosarcina cavernae]AYC29273.1 phosphatidate cytidylyltransferase [Paenisporosarcina cavernae]